MQSIVKDSDQVHRYTFAVLTQVLPEQPSTFSIETWHVLSTGIFPISTGDTP